MYLKYFGQMIKCCSFDKSSGKGGELQYIEDIKTSGFCSQGGYGWISIYPENGTLVAQINSKKWCLSNDDVDVNYFHDYANKTTKFSIKHSELNFEYQYKSWWAERDDFEVNPMAASCEEENSEEDVFGYVKMLKDNKTSASNLAELWSKNI
jgi:hypothetical protein